MSDDNQIAIPHSFIDLFIPPHAVKPTASREWIAARYELCEDLAQALADGQAAAARRSGMLEDEVLVRIGEGLAGGEPTFSSAESAWVVKRLAELLRQR